MDGHESTCLSLAMRAPKAIRLGFITLAESDEKNL